MKEMNISVSYDKASECWGKNAILSVNALGMLIHVNKKKNYLETIQSAGHKIQLQGIKKVNLTGNLWDLETSWSFWLGYRDVKKEFNIIKWCTLNYEEQKELNDRKKAIDWVRDVINLPSNELTPSKLVNKTIKLLTDNNKSNINYVILQNEELLKNKYMGIYSVGNSSHQKPLLLIIDYNPKNDKEAPVYASLVGKGVTFDTGGYNLKNNVYIDHMKSDMAGAATLAGALSLSINRGLKKRIKLYLCCAENMISSSSLKIGDTILYRNGKKVEVNNTDAEGRLLLADGLIDASKDNPELIIDAATLTGAAKIALGSDYHAVFTFDTILLNRLMQSAKYENELFWQLPLSECHRNSINSNFADLSNISSSKSTAGASTAAAFLSYFLKDYKKGWLHIDCAASYQDQQTSKWSVGATGIGVRTISRLLLY